MYHVETKLFYLTQKPKCHKNEHIFARHDENQNFRILMRVRCDQHDKNSR